MNLAQNNYWHESMIENIVECLEMWIKVVRCIPLFSVYILLDGA
jgi:hypothetical protein